MNSMKGKIVSNIHNDAIKELLFEAAMTEAIEGGAPDNEETELKTAKLVEFLWENYRDE